MRKTRQHRSRKRKHPHTILFEDEAIESDNDDEDRSEKSDEDDEDDPNLDDYEKDDFVVSSGR
jgi:hypothetical protein